MRRPFSLGWISRYRDELFGIAILSIILFHYTNDYSRAIDRGATVASDIPFYHVFMENYLSLVGSIGVELFLFLSGMGLYFSYSKDPNPGRFYRKRLLRILPSYFLLAVPFWVVKDLFVEGFGPVRMLQDLFFITCVTKGVKILWFVGLILVLYLVFPLIYHLLFGPKSVWGRRAMLATLLAGLFAGPWALSHIDPVIYDNTQLFLTRIPIFVFGCYMGAPIKEEKTVSLPVVIGVIITLTANQLYLIHTYDWPVAYVFNRYAHTLFAIPCLLVLVLLCYRFRNAEKLRKFLRLCGSYSLELYMTHITLRSLMKAYGLGMYSLPLYALMVCGAILLSILLKRAADYSASWLGSVPGLR